MSMEQLYQEVILDHAKNPIGKGLREPYSGESFQVNPTCGDEATVRVLVENGTLVDVSWDGIGCSISQASLSVMAEMVAGESLAEFDSLYDAFRSLMDSRGHGIPDAEEMLGDAAAFTGVSKYPARIKCALLGWMAAQDALAKGGRHE